jgi:hypothetical protein
MSAWLALALLLAGADSATAPKEPARRATSTISDKDREYYLKACLAGGTFIDPVRGYRFECDESQLTEEHAATLAAHRSKPAPRPQQAAEADRLVQVQERQPVADKAQQQDASPQLATAQDSSPESAGRQPSSQAQGPQQAAEANRLAQVQERQPVADKEGAAVQAPLRDARPQHTTAQPGSLGRQQSRSNVVRPNPAPFVRGAPPSERSVNCPLGSPGCDEPRLSAFERPRVKNSNCSLGLPGCDESRLSDLERQRINSVNCSLGLPGCDESRLGALERQRINSVNCSLGLPGCDESRLSALERQRIGARSKPR